MTLMEVMEHMAALLREAVRDYAAEQPSGLRPVEVYAGYPPVPENAAEKSSFIYVLATDFTDEEGEDYSTAKVEIGFSVYDEDEGNGWRSLYNLMEHVRQAMLRRRCLAGRTVLVLPVKGAVPDSQPFPQWEGKITASYQIGQPVEEGINYDNF